MNDINQILNTWWYDIFRFVPRLGLIILILGVSVVISRRVRQVVNLLAGRTEAPREVIELLAGAARVAVLVVGVIIVLGQLDLGAAVWSFVAGLGISGIIIGFALQDIVKQFAAGVLLLMLRPFHIGERIRVGAFEGTVVGIRLRATLLRTSTGDEVLIPNADVYSTALINLSRDGLRQRTVALCAPRGADIEQVRAELLTAVAAVPGVAAKPPPSVSATGLDEAKISFDLRFWYDTSAGNLDTVLSTVIATAREVLDRVAPPAAPASS